MKTKFVLSIFFIVILISSVSALTMKFTPLDAYGKIIPNTNFDYQINFTIDSNCQNVEKSFQLNNRKTNNYGYFVVDLNISGISSSVGYICEYKNGVYRKTHNITDTIIRDLYLRSATFSGDINMTNNSIIDIYQLIFSNGDYIIGNNSIDIVINKTRTVKYGYDFTEHIGEVRNIDDINSISRFIEHNTNNGTNAGGSFTAKNNLNYTLSIGVLSSNYNTSNKYAMCNAPGVSIKSPANYGLFHNYLKGFIWTNNLLDDGNFSEADNLLMILDSSGNLNITGNFTGNQYYGEMWQNSENISIVEISAKDTWTNITNFSEGNNNGFLFSNNKLICNIGGIYKVSHSESYTDGVGNEYNFVVSVNDVIQEKTMSHSLMNTANDIGVGSGDGLIRCNNGENINLQVLNKQTSSDVQIHQASINLIRVGD